MIDLLKEFLGRREQHEHDWSKWREGWDFQWHFKLRNIEDGENKPFLDLKRKEQRHCQDSGCRERETRNEQYMRQYLKMEPKETIDKDESILE